MANAESSAERWDKGKTNITIYETNGVGEEQREKQRENKMICSLFTRGKPQTQMYSITTSHTKYREKFNDANTISAYCHTESSPSRETLRSNVNRSYYCLYGFFSKEISNKQKHCNTQETNDFDLTETLMMMMHISTKLYQEMYECHTLNITHFHSCTCTNYKCICAGIIGSYSLRGI